MNDAVFLVVSAALLPGHRRSKYPIAILGVKGLQPALGQVVQALAAAAPNGFVRRADVEHLGAGRVVHPEDFADVVGQLAEAFLALAQGRLGPWVGRNVPQAHREVRLVLADRLRDTPDIVMAKWLEENLSPHVWIAFDADFPALGNGVARFAIAPAVTRAPGPARAFLLARAPPLPHDNGRPSSPRRPTPAARRTRAPR